MKIERKVKEKKGNRSEWDMKSRANSEKHFWS